MGQQRFSRCAAVWRNSRAKIDHVLEGMRRWKLIDQNAIRVCQTTKLGGLAGCLKNGVKRLRAAFYQTAWPGMGLPHQQHPGCEPVAFGERVALQISEFLQSTRHTQGGWERDTEIFCGFRDGGSLRLLCDPFQKKDSPLECGDIGRFLRSNPTGVFGAQSGVFGEISGVHK